MGSKFRGIACAALLAAGALAATSADALQCVPYARVASGIELRGDAWRWWNEAAGVYERGHLPRLGAVIVFRKHGHMQRGHVAVVTRVVSSREILIDHANWGGRYDGRGRVTKMVNVVDVSPRNDWTEVRVWNHAAHELGPSKYPTYGFIYPRGEPPAMESRAAPSMPAEVEALLSSPGSLGSGGTGGAADGDAPFLVLAADVAPLDPAPRPNVRVERLAAYVPIGSVGALASRIWPGDHEAARRAGSGRY